jgi:hypothetical protein
MDMMDKLEFWKVKDTPPSQPYKGCGSLDLEGNVTITGNLTVQQSEWVYLKGPITSSNILVNGPITASAICIKPIGEEGVEFHINGEDEISELRARLDRIEKAFKDHINSTPTHIKEIGE